MHIRYLKQALNRRLVFKKVHRLSEFNQKTWLKAYIDMNIELRKKAKNEFQKYIFKLMKSAVFEKIIKTLRKHRDIKFLTTEARRYQNQTII